jgi:nucleotide-binding universal stress UspA family protein
MQQMKKEMNAHVANREPFHTKTPFGLMRPAAIGKILYATDVSSTADRALPFALTIARRHGSTIYAVHVTQPDRYPFDPPSPLPQLVVEQVAFRQTARNHMEEQFGDVSHEILFDAGKTSQTLVNFIEEENIDLLVFSLRDGSGIRGALFGSVAAEILRKASCPALAVGPSVSSKPRPNGQLNQILFATDFGPESMAAAPYAISLAEEHRAQLILFHSIESEGDVPAMLRALRELVPFGVDLRCDPICVVEHGVPNEKILEVAEGHGADLIVLGVHGHKGHMHDGLMRSGVLRIVTGAKCPVLTVRGSV